MAERYIRLLLEGIIFAGTYFFIKPSFFTLILLFKFIFFYIAVQDIGKAFGNNEEMISLLFIGRLIAVYLETCEPGDYAQFKT